ncbi:hypothetical protein HMPREF9103_02309 [Lentilactobacillus parafarraginis F0439]|uniref:Uncharacterized protein n=1 Tax=Lentilactobacillus parafarraginis F0439 TaxID=797515 RepID=G9ZRE8_9LACO|nr:YaaL family protein [Lentilactobacillus parafarraginis]EHL96649.1 hypothetical protein HMPREF9103_02309 [Lentilactobacillus parafarraginis F0439]
MFFGGLRKQNVKSDYDQRLLDLINALKEQWDHAVQTQDAVADSDLEMTAETALANH